MISFLDQSMGLFVDFLAALGQIIVFYALVLAAIGSHKEEFRRLWE